MIELRTLGAVELSGPGGHEPPGILTHPKRLALLAYLAVATPRGFHRRDTLLALLWPELDAERARAALRKTVHHLRRALGDDVLLRRGDDELGLAPDRFWCDAAALEAHLAAGERAAAVELYRGDLLPGVFIAEASEFERWLEERRAALRRSVVDAARALAEQDAARGDPFAAIGWTRRSLALEPLDERATRRLLTLLREVGDRAGALRTYDEFARRLAAELEVEPSAETEALVRELRAERGAERGAERPAPLVSVAPPAAAAEPGRDARERSLGDAPEPPRPTPEPRPALREPPEPRPALREPPTPVRATPIRARVVPLPGQMPLPWRAMLAALLLLVLAATAAARWLVGRGAPAAPAVSRSSVAVFPFSYRGSPAHADVGGGIASLLGTNLDDVDLRSVDGWALLADLPPAARASLDPARGRDLAGRHGAALYVLGDIVEAGGTLRISASMYDATRGAEPVARASASGSPDDLIAMVDGLAAQLLAGRSPAADAARSRLAARTTRSLPALKAYLEGERQFRAGRYTLAVDAFQRATAEDSTFALAHYRLAAAYSWSSDPAARPAAQRAVRFADRLAPPDRALVEAVVPFFAADADEAERRYRKILATAPHEGEAWYFLGEVLFHQNPARGRPVVEARPLFERSVRIGPRDGPVTHLLEIAAIERDYAAFDTLLRYIEPDAHFGPVGAVMSALMRGDESAQARELAKVARLPDAELVNLGRHMLFLVEDRAGAARVLDLLRAPERPPDVRAAGLLLRAHLEAGHGRLREAAAAIDAARPLDPGRALETLAALHALPFVPVPPETARATRQALEALDARAIPPSGSFPGDENRHPLLRQYLIGQLSARLGEHDRALAAADAAVREAAPGDSAFAADLARGVRARVARERGDHAAVDSLLGLNRIEHGGWTAPGAIPFFSQHAERWLRAEALAALGRADEALGWLGSFAEHNAFGALYLAPAHLGRGELLERAGRRAEAAAEYAKLVRRWREADAELRPRVEEVERRLARLRARSG